MKASISYQELQKIVAEQTHQPISFEFVDRKTLKVLYELNLGLIRKKVGVDLKILDIVGTDLRLQYSAGFGMEGLMGMALNMVRDRIPTGLLEEQPDRVLLIRLGMVDKLKPVFERIDLKEVIILGEALELVGDFK